MFKITGKSGEYIVRFDMINHHMWHMNVMGWSCTCPSYVKGRRVSCKHIKQVKQLLELQKIISEVKTCDT